MPSPPFITDSWLRSRMGSLPPLPTTYYTRTAEIPKLWYPLYVTDPETAFDTETHRYVYKANVDEMGEFAEDAEVIEKGETSGYHEIQDESHKQAFYDKENCHEKLRECMEVLEENFDIIRGELQSILNRERNISRREQHPDADGVFVKWPESIVQHEPNDDGELLLDESQTHSVKWSVFGLIGFGRLLEENIRLAPKTYEIITQKLPLRVFTAGFSRMRPGAWIEPHAGYKGYSEYVLRMHLPLIVPQETHVDSSTDTKHPDTNTNCFLMCYNEKRRWQQGKCLVFDDSLTHCAWNMTKDTRIILLIDVHYPYKSWLPEGSEALEPDVHSDDFSAGLQGMLHVIDMGKERDRRKFADLDEQ